MPQTGAKPFDYRNANEPHLRRGHLRRDNGKNADGTSAPVVPRRPVETLWETVSNVLARAASSGG
eukprot:10924363-Lingulodinium_polyedra.AAC.1